MKCEIKDKYAGVIGDLEDRNDLQLVTDSQDVQDIKDYFGNAPAVEDYDGFFVKVGDGELDEVYAFVGSIPVLNKPIFEIVKECKPTRRKKNAKR